MNLDKDDLAALLIVAAFCAILAGVALAFSIGFIYGASAGFLVICFELLFVAGSILWIIQKEKEKQ